MTVDPFAERSAVAAFAGRRADHPTRPLPDVVEQRDGVPMPDYRAAWEWSVARPAAFWSPCATTLRCRSLGEASRSISATQSPTGLPGARWFPGATLNAAAVMLGRSRSSRRDVAVVARSHTREPSELTFGELRREVARARRGLARARAWASAIVSPPTARTSPRRSSPSWPRPRSARSGRRALPSSAPAACSTASRRSSPKVLLAIDGYRYGERPSTGAPRLPTIVDRLGLARHRGPPRLPRSRRRPAPDGARRASRSSTGPPIRSTARCPSTTRCTSSTPRAPPGCPSRSSTATAASPSSTSRRSPCTRDLGPGDRFFWFTTTGWMMWNYLVSGLSVGADDRALRRRPRLARPRHAVAARRRRRGRRPSARRRRSSMPCRQARPRPGASHDLAALRGVGLHRRAAARRRLPLGRRGVVGDVPLSSISGGTDVCTAFVGGGAAAAGAGRRDPLPLPRRRRSTPFDAGAGGDRRAGRARRSPRRCHRCRSGSGATTTARDCARRTSTRYPDMWRHGDWITIDRRRPLRHLGPLATPRSTGAACASGPPTSTPSSERSRGGRLPGRAPRDPRRGATSCSRSWCSSRAPTLDDDLVGRLRSTLRAELSPRHVPDRFIEVPAIPRTLSGKKTELPVKRILAGDPRTRSWPPGRSPTPSRSTPSSPGPRPTEASSAVPGGPARRDRLHDPSPDRPDRRSRAQHQTSPPNRGPFLPCPTTTFPTTRQALPRASRRSWSSAPARPGSPPRSSSTSTASASTVLEADDVVGGISRTVERDGWRFDIGGHRFFTKVQPVEDLWHEILPDEDFLHAARA